MRCNGEKDVTEILPNLWLGNFISAMSDPFIKKFNIKYIINITKNVPSMFKYIEYLNIPISDSDTENVNLNSFYDTTSKFIYDSLKTGNGVLIHCMRGHHRSASVVCAFLIRFLNINHLEAISYINSKRICALIRDTFMVKSLTNYYVHSQRNKLNLS